MSDSLMTDASPGATACPMKGCTETLDFNDRTKMDFLTCRKCRFKCPNFNTCNGVRGKMINGWHFKTCIKCRPDYDPTKVRTPKRVSKIDPKPTKMVMKRQFRNTEPVPKVTERRIQQDPTDIIETVWGT